MSTRLKSILKLKVHLPQKKGSEKQVFSLIPHPKSSNDFSKTTCMVSKISNKKFQQNFLKFSPKNMFQSAGEFSCLFSGPPFFVWPRCSDGVNRSTSEFGGFLSASHGNSGSLHHQIRMNLKKLIPPKFPESKKSPKKPSLKFFHHLKFHKNTCSRHLVALFFHLPHLEALL